MLRGIDDKGALFIGLVRREFLDALLAGKRVCLPGDTDANGVVHPHVCLFVRDNNAELVDALREYFPGGFVPGASLEQVSTTEPTGEPKPEQLNAAIQELCNTAAQCPGGRGALLIVALRGESNLEAAIAAAYDPADKRTAQALLTALERAKERIKQDLDS